MEKINVAELLRNCPKGMELDCTMYDDISFCEITDDPIFPICVKRTDGFPITLTKYGGYSNFPSSKCVIFPKGKTTWEGFQRPFKDGDIVTSKNRGLLVACIYKERKDNVSFNQHIALYKGSLGVLVHERIALTDDELRFATEEEKAKLFKAIKYKGYKWNEETKTLEKLPKFKNGDIVYNRLQKKICIYYLCDDGVPRIKDCRYNESNIQLQFEKLEYPIPIVIQDYRLATKGEKEKLLQAIKDNGYRWNPETKTLEKLIEPKFKIEKGKWYVCIKDLLDNYANKAFRKGDTYLSTQDGSLIPSNSNVPFGVVCPGTYFRDWTIEDAKDGDILCTYECDEPKIVFILKGTPKKQYALSYHCYYNIMYPHFAPDIEKGCLAPNDEDVKPATKEQCELLFQKIKEAGYKWNPDNKTLEELPKFKNGDVIMCESARCTFISIFKENAPQRNSFIGHCTFDIDDNEFEVKDSASYFNKVRFATKREKELLFAAIERNGYQWNSKTNTLERVLKFKVGDTIVDTFRKCVGASASTGRISQITDDKYIFADGSYIYIKSQDNWELVEPIFKVWYKIKSIKTGNIYEIIKIVPNYYIAKYLGSEILISWADQNEYELVPVKFDISILKPFESRVLVRDRNNDEWRGQFFSHYNNCSNRPYICIGVEGLCEYKQCIPYEGNEHLLGKTDDCNKYFKIWEN